MALCQLVQETAQSNMDLLIDLSEENAQGCKEALETVQLLLVGNEP